MYTINIKVKPNPKDPSMVKLEMIFFKTNYPRRVRLGETIVILNMYYSVGGTSKSI